MTLHIIKLHFTTVYSTAQHSTAGHDLINCNITWYYQTSVLPLNECSPTDYLTACGVDSVICLSWFLLWRPLIPDATGSWYWRWSACLWGISWYCRIQSPSCLFQSFSSLRICQLYGIIHKYCTLSYYLHCTIFGSNINFPRGIWLSDSIDLISLKSTNIFSCCDISFNGFCVLKSDYNVFVFYGGKSIRSVQYNRLHTPNWKRN